MKKLFCLLLTTLMLCGTFGGINLHAADTKSTDEDFRGVWVSSVLNLDFPSKKGLTVDQMKKEAADTIDHAVRTGLNAIILQVRPTADALYASDLFSWSEYLTGTQGTAPASGFDPLAYWVEQCHAVGLELHAWINPYRVTHTADKRTDVKDLSATNPARLNPSWAVAYKNALYFDPGLPQTRQLVIDGIKEIILNYDVDGIHLDDYFYPSTDFPDDATYQKYGGGMAKDDWRRDNVNTLIAGIQSMIRETKPSVRFGVSPFAIWQNKASSPLGSDTRGAESYKTMYADTRRWVKEGWVDYICPQIYWLIGFEIADYQKVLGWWADVCRGTGVDLYVGHAAYREAEKQTGWDGEMIRQLQMNETLFAGDVQGSAFFRSALLQNSVGDQLAQYYTYAATAPTPRMNVLTVAQPSRNISTTAAGYNIMGTSNPDRPLLMNGSPVTGRTPEGFFSVYVPIDKGANSFTFKQDGQTTVTRVITGTTAPASAGRATMASAAITNAYPAKDEFVSSGDSVTFRCTAPVGASVSVTINGLTLPMRDTNAAANANLGTNAIYATTYSVTHTFTDSGEGAVKVIGRPTYTMTYNRQTKQATGANVYMIQKNAPFHISVSADSAWLYPNATTDGGTAWQAVKHQRDTATAVSKDGAWVRLGSGAWIERTNVSLELERTLVQNVLTNGSYVKADTEDILQWNARQNPVTYIEQNGRDITIQFGLQAVVPPHNITSTQLEKDSMFTSIQSGVANGVPYITLTLKEDARLEGVYTDRVDGVFRVHFKKTRALASGSKPLSGFTFVIDAGHGGSDTGATGPMGAALAEKHINLSNADKLAGRLEAMGATVTRVRVTDTYYSLYDRTEVSRLINPDMFISMHANSMSESTNASNIRGFSVWYRNELSKPLADQIIDDLYAVNPLTTRRQLSNQSNFYVCRPSWAPSVIIEASFMCNPDDFSWLVNEKAQDKMADAMIDSILRYYGK